MTTLDLTNHDTDGLVFAAFSDGTQLVDYVASGATVPSTAVTFALDGTREIAAFAGAGYANTGAQSFGGVDLFADADATFTVLVCGKQNAINSTGTLISKASATVGTRTLQVFWSSGALSVYLRGAPTFGTTRLFSDSTDKFIVAQKYATSAVNGTAIAKSGASASAATFKSYYESARSPGVYVRGTLNGLADNLNTGASRAISMWWDGADGAHTREQLGSRHALVGTAAEETTQNILLGAINGGASGFLNGSVQQIVLVDTFDTDAMRRLRDWANGATINAFAYSAGEIGAVNANATGGTGTSTGSGSGGTATGVTAGSGNAPGGTGTSVGSGSGGAASGEGGFSGSLSDADISRIVAAVLAALQATAIPVNVTQFNGNPTTGTGRPGDPVTAA